MAGAALKLRQVIDNRLDLTIAREIVSPGSVVSADWKEIWQNHPLVFHDRDLVRASRAKDGAKLALTDVITTMLETHPGPVQYFRLDSFVMKRGCNQLEEWMEVLSKKDVEHVVVVNSR